LCPVVPGRGKYKKPRDRTRADTVVIVDHLGSDIESAIAARLPDLATPTALPAAVEVIDAPTWEALQRLARRDLRPALDVPPEPGGRPEVGERRASPGDGRPTSRGPRAS